MNGHELMTTSPRQSKPPATDANHFVLTFENNRYASELFGQFDQNLKLLEQRLQIEARPRGNSVSISGDIMATNQARRALDYLYGRLQSGGSVELSDVEGAIRMAVAADDQLLLPTMERKAKLTMSQISTRKKTIVARTPTQDAYIRAMERSELVFGVGPAGTGKTYLAVAYAAQLLERGAVDRIVLSRPAVEAGERLGFLPGDMKEKVDPYLRPLYDALYDMMPGDKVERAITAGVIEIAPLAFMRGRTLANAAVILDEAQNTTSMQMKMFLTRLGENGRMIVTGDPSQIDLPRGMKSGLVEALQILRGVEGVSVVRFKDVDVVRHPMVARIVRAYESQSAVQDESEHMDR
ncbi:PhoH family protein [Rhizobium sp. TRM96647]|uniref:PhoH family protein n=1 Tax=unclassified Rhizobium TaxID=2613769 RepID=UPI0021E7FAD8|nr:MULTISPECIES: PhoH family protein [unclassified Rhizobium]MCV3736600.1 PhoH family protein [Rhizobium sp. TRM96647]MCV3758969.1 PhoH family protein [Rhizobium sp. TRM96650]